MITPHDYTAPQLAKVKVTPLGRLPLMLRCQQCGAVWRVKQKGLRMPKGYWQCPNGCNRQ